ncbi:uncharacterized protein LOC114334769 [Diabrotica virgifera virgifera]|uniref:Uncharacterized protein n=1 Tax=Diabrotica virgifera virgifera TaxID=50390 RepID=A0ABM5ISJ2_DIAVI|nr:uncharacterized protein LOC114334769 [Diabrotica virgifera virgifera]
MENRLSVEKSNQKMSRAQRIIESALKQISQDDVSQSYNETAVNNKIEIYDDATQTSGSTELAAPDLTAESQNDMSSNSAMQEEIITSCDDDYVDNTSEDENWEPLSKKASNGIIIEYIQVIQRTQILHQTGLVVILIKIVMLVLIM